MEKILETKSVTRIRGHILIRRVIEGGKPPRSCLRNSRNLSTGTNSNTEGINAGDFDPKCR